MTVSPDTIRIIELPVRLELKRVLGLLRTHKKNIKTDELAAELSEKVRRVARPRAIYRASHVDCTDKEGVVIDGIRFDSRVLGKNLAGLDIVFPYISTVGTEVDDIPIPGNDLWRQYCLDIIKMALLVSSDIYLSERLMEMYGIKRLAQISPGEIDDFPIERQRLMFELFGGEEKKIGVSLTAGGVIRPTKSRSGILFANDTGYLTCRLCTQVHCPGRRAKYDPEAWKEYLDPTP